MNFFLNKKGISGVIVVMILIAIAIVAIGIVWFTVNNLLNKQVEGISSSSDCLGVLLDIKSVGNCSSGSTSCNVTVERKSGGEDIDGVRVIVSDGSSTLSGDYTGSLGPLEMTTISATGSALDGDATTAKVAALINSDSGETYVCEIIDVYDY